MRTLSVVWVMSSLVALGCASKGSKTATAPTSKSPPPATSASSPRPSPKALTGVPARLATTARPRTVGPFLARGAPGSLLAWIGTADATPGPDQRPVPAVGRRLVTLAVAADGTPALQARAVANVPIDTTALVLRAAHDGAGYFAAHSALLDRGQAISVVALTPEGGARGAPLEVARTSDNIEWLDVVPTPQGATIVWAEETRQGQANIMAAAIDSAGRARAQPSVVARGIRAWQAVRTGPTVGMVLVTASGDRGNIAWQRLDEAGRPVGAAVKVATNVGVTGDVDAVPVASGAMLGWTDRAGEDPEVVLAWVDGAGAVRGPKRVVEGAGGASLVSLTGAGDGAAIAWEDPRRRGRSTRVMNFGRVAASLELDPGARLSVHGNGPVELVATEGGFGLLATTRVCAADPLAAASPRDRAPGCPPDATLAPAFIRFDGHLSPSEVHPLRLGEDGASAAVAWGLSCAGERCVSLAATGAVPTPVYVLDLAPRTSTHRAPFWPAPPPDAPRIASLQTLTTGESMVEVVSARLGEALAVTTLAARGEEARAPAGEDRNEPEKDAVVSLRVGDGPTATAQAVLTKRAVPTGGLAMAAGAKPEDGAAIAWVSKVRGDPQVVLAKVDRFGRKVNEVQLTGATGDASSVALAWADGGWIVAWVDGRDGNGEVYAAKVDRDLNRVGKEERLTNAPGDATDVTLCRHGDRMWVAWSDPRENPKEGHGDIYVAPLRLRDGHREAEGVRVLATAAHSRTPRLVSTTDPRGGRPAGASDTLAVGWIEEAPLGVDAGNGAAYGAMVALLDASGRPAGEPTRLALAGDGLATSVLLEALPAVASDAADPKRHSPLRAVVVRSGREEVTLDAVELGTEPRSFELLVLDGSPSREVAASLHAGTLLFTDDGTKAADRRLRRATLRWRR